MARFVNTSKDTYTHGMKEATLLSHWIEQQRAHSSAAEKAALYTIFDDLSTIGKLLSDLIRKSGIDILGAYGSTNPSGDTVQKLDIIANDLCKNFLREQPHFAAIASEEEADIVLIPGGEQSPYVIAFDPLDGSKNISSNGPIGTIMTIYRRSSAIGSPATVDDFLLSGTVVGSGFVLYGARTLFLFSVGDGVHVAQLDPETQEWALLQEHLQFSDAMTIYSHNDRYVEQWDAASQAYLTSVKKRYPLITARFAGALLFDLYHLFIDGGIFLRPYDDAKTQSVKIRLVYELRAMAFLIEQAGGAASDGQERILHIDATDIHQTHPLIAGNAAEVAEYERIRSTHA